MLNDPNEPIEERKSKVKNVPIANRLEVSFRSGKETKDIELERSRLRLGEQTVIDCRKDDPVWSSDTFPAELSRTTGFSFRSLFPVPAFPVHGAAGSPSPGTPVFTTDVIQAMQLFSLQSHVWSQLLINTFAIVPLRLRVPWSASAGARTSSELGAGGENLLAALGSTEKVQPTNKTLVELVSDWLASKKVLKRLHVEGDKTTRMLQGDEITGPVNINVAGMGEGISQVLPIIARSLSVVSYWGGTPCVIVEQPEIHLHPALQADLADLFIDCAKTGQQVIVETHSEHLVLRVRRRIAEGTLDRAQVSILHVEKTGTASTARPLDINEQGNFSNWPVGFFDEAYQEAMAMAEASIMAAKARLNKPPGKD